MEPSPFIISVGTQVVLRAAKRIPNSDVVKPAGSVAVVIKSPSTNKRSYAIRFVDGVELRVKFGEVSIRRREINDELATPGADMRDFVVYRVLVGSRAFGLSNELSDEDRRGVFLPPAELNWSLTKPPEQLEYSGDGVEEVDWEIEKFLFLALQANPNILETLWSPVILHADETGRGLREMRNAFLSRHLFKTYSGYVLSQFNLMRKGFESNRRYKPKHAMHLIRLLHSGIHAMREGEIRVDVAEHRDELLTIRSGSTPFEEVRERALQLNRQFQQAFDATKLPERPDVERVNRFLVEARRRRANESRRHCPGAPDRG